MRSFSLEPTPMAVDVIDPPSGGLDLFFASVSVAAPRP